MAKQGRTRHHCLVYAVTFGSISNHEALLEQWKLRQQVEQVLTENAQLKRKLHQSQDSFGARTIATRHPDDDGKTVRGIISDDKSTIREPGVRRNNTLRSVIVNNFRNSIPRFAFENILERSRVIQKSARAQESDRSFTSSAIRSDAWSVFTGYSLAQLSVLSVIAIPISKADITNAEYYLDLPVPKLEPSMPDAGIELGSPSISTKPNAGITHPEADHSEIANGGTRNTGSMPRDGDAAAREPEGNAQNVLGEEGSSYDDYKSAKSITLSSQSPSWVVKRYEAVDDDAGWSCRGCDNVRKKHKALPLTMHNPALTIIIQPAPVKKGLIASKLPMFRISLFPT
jgi:hypothetical protein